MYYSAVWTECGCLIGCWHENNTVVDAASCVPCAVGYVVGVENGAMRALSAEEAELQGAAPSIPPDNPAAPTEATVSDPGYAVMIIINVGGRWRWTTWMRFGTYAEAAANARESNKVVRFRSPEWVALRQHSEPASPIVIKAPRESVLPQGEGETLLEFTLLLLTTYGFPKRTEPISDVEHRLLNTRMIDLVFSRLSGSETVELERMYAEDEHALREGPGNRLRTPFSPPNGCP
jgi:hypothetical protein